MLRKIYNPSDCNNMQVGDTILYCNREVAKVEDISGNEWCCLCTDTFISEDESCNYSKILEGEYFVWKPEGIEVTDVPITEEDMFTIWLNKRLNKIETYLFYDQIDEAKENLQEIVKEFKDTRKSFVTLAEKYNKESMVEVIRLKKYKV